GRDLRPRRIRRYRAARLVDAGRTVGRHEPVPFRASFDCLWCGAAHSCRGPDDLEGWAQLCPDCVGKAGDNGFLRFRLRQALTERGAARPATAAPPATSATSPAAPATADPSTATSPPPSHPHPQTPPHS